jgi:hypothetical protein
MNLFSGGIGGAVLGVAIALVFLVLWKAFGGSKNAR